VLGVSGGIAAYKAVQLARDLTLAGCAVDTVLTPAARSFVGPTSFEGVTGRRVYTDFMAGDGSALHLSLGADADAVIVAPATADLLARASHGRADDLLATVLLSARAPVLLAPAMNARMWDHPQTRRNVAHCRDVLGYRILGPDTGELGAGEGSGVGRMLEPEALLHHVGRALCGTSKLGGARVVITAGPTQEAVDPVRFLGNRSSGRMGFALAREGWLRGAEVTLVTGPVSLADPEGVRVIRVETARQMLSAIEGVIGNAHVAVFAAAVADFRPATAAEGKLKRGEVAADPILRLVENPDVAGTTLSLGPPGCVRVGFALETHDLLASARGKLEAKGFDLIVANDPGEEGAGFGVTTNRVTILDRQGTVEVLPILSKDRVASAILDRVEEILPAEAESSGRESEP